MPMNKIVKDQTAAPQFDLSAVYQKTVVVKAGENLKVEIPVLGHPRPSVLWKRGDRELQQKDGINIENTADLTIFSKRDIKWEDGGEYTMVGKNNMGTVTETITVKVHDVPGPPTGPVMVNDVSCDRILISWEPPEIDGGVPVTNYIVEMRETIGKSWVELTATLVRTAYKVVRLTTGTEYQFRVRAQNRYGIGPCIKSEPVVAAYPFDVPGKPGTPQVVAFTKDVMTITWDDPASDGGSPVLGYHIERKEKNSILWQKVSKTLVIGNSYKSPGLIHGISYEFRVIAENVAGWSKPSSPSETAYAVDPVDPPKQPQAINITRHEVTLSWDKPEFDGGFPITGYTVEKKELPDGRWLKANFGNILDTTFTVSALTEDASYEFRILAKNSTGTVSKPSQPSEVITCREDIEKPKIDVDLVFKHGIVAKAGEAFTLAATVTGKPIPSLVWTKEGKQLEYTSKMEIKVSDLTTKLINKDSVRRDGGMFVLTASNAGGVASQAFNVKVLDRPGPPDSVTVSDVTAEKCAVNWLPPSHDGGAKIEHYVIEKRETSRITWTSVASDLEVNRYKVTKNMRKGNEYIFRVMAVNKYGIGEPTESEPTVITDPYVPSDPPQQPEVTTITRDSMVVCWGHPISNGGSEISSYVVERRDKTGVRWIKCNKRNVTDLRFKVSGLTEGHEYEFRVLAENAAGLSSPSPESVFYKACDKAFPPGPIGNPKVLDTTKSSITVAWSKPVYDGGSEITGYQVETCLPRAEEWKIVSPINGLTATSFTITGLKEHQEYKINISALNIEGVGEPTAVPGRPKAEELSIAPEIELDAELRKIISLRSCATLRLCVPISGRPTPNVKWTRENGETIGRANIETTASFTSLLIDRVDRFDSGRYNLTVENNSGVKTAFITVRVLDSPGAPQNLTVKEVTKDSAFLTWDPPIIDGGSKTKHYVVEKRECTRRAYCTVDDSCPKTSLRIGDLTEGCSYFFRVMAENEFGVGIPAETADSVKVSETALPPGKVTVKEVTNRGVTLTWEKPDHDGGSRVTGYIVEMQEKGSREWAECSTVRGTEAVISGLTQGKEYSFRISAVNEKGTSDPRLLGVPVVPKDSAIPPTFKLLISTFSALAGNDLKIDVPYSAEPQASVTWLKDGVALKQTTRVNTEVTDRHLYLVIREATRDDVGSYTIKLTNRAGEASEDISVVVLDKPGPPIGPIIFDEVTADSVTLTWQPPEYDGGCTINNYIVEKRDTSTTDWQNVSATVARTTIKAARLKTDCEYQFRIAAENRYGQSSALVSEAIVAQYPFDLPGAPSTPTIQYATKESMLVEWNEPISDGGSKILGYHLESKERNSILWVKQNKFIIPETKFKVSGLDEGIEYEFRVFCENIVGLSKASKVSESYLARDPCDPPGKPEAIIVTGSAVSLRWAKPAYNGGSKITGYLLEKRELPDGRWMRVNFTNIMETEFEVTGLDREQKYEFRVTAKNAAGVFSLPSESTGKITAKDEVDPPSIGIDSKYTGCLMINAGESFRIDADIQGKPVPTACWLKGGQELTNSARLEIKNTQLSASLNVREAIRVDGGQYTLLVQNTGGEKSVNINVKVLDRPGPPEGPIKIYGVTNEKCSISWKPPKEDGGADISHYVIERRETSRLVWTRVESEAKALTQKITKLFPGNEYIFRVIPVNKYGVGEALESNPVIAANPFVEPGAPTTVEVSNVSKDSMVVTWERPSDDGGSSITGYIVEKRDKDGVRWTRCNKHAVSELRLRVTGLIEGHSYEFRVSAENEAGVGEPSIETIYERALDPTFKPGPPNNPKVTDVSRSSVALSWGKPIYDGGCEIQAYVVEMRETTDDEWIMCTPPTGITETSFKVCKLLENHKYKFRIFAKNKMGVGEHANLPGSVLLEEKLEAPDLDLNAEQRKIISIKAGSTLKLSIPIRGRPAPEVRWGKSEGDIKDTASINTTSSYTSLMIESVDRFDTGKYTVTAINAGGVKSAFISVRVLDTPSEPQNFTVKDITKDSITLTWEPPALDSGLAIKHYIVEKRESIRKAYSTVATCNKMLWKIEELQEGCNYFFRVLAENEYGIGLPAESPEPIKIAEVPQPPGRMTVVDVTKNTIKLAWEKPDDDGGTRISHYEVEMQVEDKWLQCAQVKTLETVIANLAQGQEYTFRVFAVNDKGKSDPKNLGSFVQLKDQIVLPAVNPRFSSYSVAVGSNLQIEVPIAGQPKPTITWTKDGARLRQTTRLNVIHTEDHTILTLTEATRDDGGTYNISVANSLGRTDANIEVITLDKPGPPTGPVRLDDISPESVTLSWDPPRYIGGCQISNYIVEKKDTTTTNWITVSATVARTTLKIPSLRTGTEYQFRVFAENRYGRSTALDSEPVVAQYPFKEPGYPSTPYVTAYTKESMVVEWNEPVSDGGSPVLGYHLERKEKNSILWTKINKSLIRDTRFKTTQLEEGIEYEFRVSAENIVGIGKCSKVSEGCVARDPCNPPGKPVALIVTRHSVTLRWTSPEYNGNSVVTGYVVEKRELPDGRWMKANFTNITDNEFSVEGLEEGVAYDFKVIARNAAGAISKPSETTGPITAKIDVEPPTCEIDPKFSQILVLKAGESFRLEATVQGKPVPNIQWFKGDVEIEMSHKYELKKTDFKVVLIVRDAVRIDSGQYTLHLTNVGGTKTASYNVKVLDRPGPPKGPLLVTGVTCEKCALSWLPPEQDGGSRVSHYAIQKRETSHLSWTIVANECETTVFKVTKLVKGNEYIFRVMAVNVHGTGEPLESLPVAIKDPYVAPDPPKEIEITNISSDSMTLCWSRSENDGGSEITGYFVEKRDKAGVRWTRCNKHDITELRFRVTGLTEDHEYEFRVSAENAAGPGEPSPPTAFFKACDPTFKPGPPIHAHVLDTTNNSITLAWGRPIYDGGCEIQGYKVEITKVHEEEWSTCSPLGGLDATVCTIPNLKEHQEYHIRVRAINKEGAGEPVVLPGPIKAVDYMLAPEIELDPALRKGVVVRAGGYLKLWIPFKGVPIPEVDWAKDNGDLPKKAHVENGSDYTVLSIDSCDREDSGKYTLELINSSGIRTAFVHVKVLDTPGPPLNLTVKDIAKNSVTLSWEPPAVDGGASIKRYIVDKRESTRQSYTNVTNECTSSSIRIRDLDEGVFYYFRVMAENEFGVGVAAETEEPIKTAEVPLSVGKVSLIDVMMNSVLLSWEKPDCDGGSRIQGYYIEWQCDGSEEWIMAATTKCCDGAVSDLSAGEYQFRVSAFNDKGTSEPRLLAATVVISDSGACGVCDCKQMI
ncbi:titin-like [Engraulis encrasicolus]|uniref:titin-like n=1 Tax=Engraulis encrasicolus TaxID=184585 RepID=UPI002FD5B9CE